MNTLCQSSIKNESRQVPAISFMKSVNDKVSVDAPGL
jgi:hypothetical protein